MTYDMLYSEARNAQTMETAEANRQLQNASATDVIKWASKKFGLGLYALTSAGVDSAVMLDHISRVGIKIPVIFINTGFLPTETLAFKDELELKFGMRFYEFRPSDDEIELAHRSSLWARDPDQYSLMTKLNPLRRAIRELGAAALLTAIRSDQTSNRAKLGCTGYGNDGEVRVRPFINWPKSDIARYISEHQLPRNPLYYQGFDSVGDIHTTRAGQDREGRDLNECGMHVVGGKVVRTRLHELT